MLPNVLKKIRWRILESINRRNFKPGQSRPIVSFTFDDFPKSALHIGGNILKSYGVHGTYYASMGLMGKEYSTGKQYTYEDITNLIRDGHELGCHTYDHISCSFISLKKFYADAIKGMKAIEELTGGDKPQSFSYPKGYVTIRAKRLIGRQFSCCRGIFPGVNESPVDLDLLKANNIYSDSFDIDKINQLLDANEEANGWLIFYTHDISDTPSAFGCRPVEFEKVVDSAAKRKHAILPVERVIWGTF